MIKELGKIIKNSYFILAILVFFIVLINSMTSPIYDVSLMNDDAHLFYVIGRAMKAGKVAYIDVFDHKGLYLFFISLIGSIVEYNHIGLFIMQLILVYLNAVLIFKIIKNYVGEGISILGALFYAILHVSHYFSYGAFQGESLLLPFLNLSYYLGFLYFKNVSDSDMSHKPAYMLAHGVLFGVFFLTKPNIALPYLPFAIILLIILLKNKLYKNLIINIIFGLIGMIIAATPVILYCTINHCMNEMIDATYFFNMRYMGGTALAMNTTESQIMWYVKNYSFIFIAIVLSTIIICKKKDLMYIKKVAYTAVLVFALTSMLMAGRAYEYYANVVVIFFLPLVTFILYKIDKVSNENRYKMVVEIFGVIILFIYSILAGRNFTLSAQEHMLRSANAIREVYNDNFGKKRKVEVYALGAGAFVYNILNAIPEERYFTSLKVEYEKAPEVYEEMYNYIVSKRADFVVVCLDQVMVTNKASTKKILTYLDDHYKLISNALGLYMYKKK